MTGPAISFTTGVVKRYRLRATVLALSMVVIPNVAIAAPKISAPTIVSFTTSTTSVAGNGGQVTLGVKVRNGQRCTLSSNLPLPRLPRTVTCERASVKVDVPRNILTTTRKYSITLTAAGATTSKTARVNVTVGVTSALRIGAFTTSRNSLTSAGGVLRVNTFANGAKTCVISSKPAISGLPAEAPCAAGSLDIEVPRNSEPTTRDYSLTMTANGSSLAAGDATKVTTISVAGMKSATAIQLALGNAHSCALMGDSKVQCWGNNEFGQLGDGTTSTKNAPVPLLFASATGFTDLAAGDSHTCGLLNTGVVQCWGLNDNGQLGNSTTTDSSTPVSVTGVTNAIAISAGGHHSCALLADHTVQCWGLNDSRQLGDGTTTDQSTPVAVAGVTNAKSISAGTHHTCALLFGGYVKCWGGPTQASPYTVSGTGPATADTVRLDAGGDVTCRLTVTGAVTGCGYSAASSVVRISAGPAHTCAVLSSAATVCVGETADGQLGHGYTTHSYDAYKDESSVERALIPAATEVEAGGHHTCAILQDGSITCWGSNSDGQLGDGNTPVSVHASRVPGITGATSITAGTSHNCVTFATGKMKCWGGNFFTQLGTPTLEIPSYYTQYGSAAGDLPGFSFYNDSAWPVEVQGLSTATSAAAGNTHTCARTTAGGVKCWGDHRKWQLGIGRPDFWFGAMLGTDPWGTPIRESVTPLDVTAGSLTSSSPPILAGVTSIAARDNLTCAVINTGSVSCWGGGRPYEGAVYAAFPVQGITNAISVSVGRGFMCALLSGGAVKCAGMNSHGQLGNGTWIDTDTNGVPLQDMLPVWGMATPVSGITNAIRITAGQSHACALLSGGTTKCWGDNSQGQLGIGAKADSNTPVTVQALSTANAISAGGAHTCARVTGATVECWGANGSGQLGDGLTRNRSGVVSVAGVSGVTQLASGGAHTCALEAGGIAMCWGDNQRGQLGRYPYGPVKVVDVP